MENSSTEEEESKAEKETKDFLREVREIEKKLEENITAWDIVWKAYKIKPSIGVSNQLKKLANQTEKLFGDLLAIIEQTEEIIFIVETKGYQDLSQRAADNSKVILFNLQKAIESKRQVFTSQRALLVSNINSNSSNNGEIVAKKTFPHQDMSLKQLGGTRAYLEKEQEEHLDDLHRSASKLGALASTINVEIEEQNKLLDDLDDNVDKTLGNMEGALKQMDKLFQVNNRCETVTILILVGIASFLFFLIASTI